ncbi:hypothetical protein MX629_13600 [Carnobacterium divergens]|uniref:Uncharacterized protein n=1 Tax=Carnobacterium divergens TaxID=2748 RepID=A0AAW8RID9_CARDV|nr:hypothetical protein [Carnobacterium divergens]MDT1959454.1 hypothetical protein [Carnobacterium divergens]MDT1975421.1 hypothetical protein [Carnobacterium divergens]
MKKTIKLQSKKIIGGLMLLTCVFSMLLSFGNTAKAASLPTNEKLTMSAHGKLSHDLQGYAATTGYFGYDYAILVPTISRSTGVYLENTHGDYYRIKSDYNTSPGYNYYAVTNRGYFYCAKKADASEFKIVKNSDGYYNIYNSGSQLMPYGSTSDIYITTGGSGGTVWNFK